MTESKHSIKLRRATVEDAQEVTRLFLNTVRKVNARDYSPEQIKVWAPDSFPVDKMINKIKNSTMFVAEDGTGIAGIGSLSVPNCLDLLFVRYDRLRHGIGKALISVVEQEAIRAGAEEIVSDVSITAKPVFLASGYTVMNEKQVEIGRQMLTNYKMRKSLKFK